MNMLRNLHDETSGTRTTFRTKFKVKSFAGIAQSRWGDALNAPRPVQGERIGSRKDMMKSGDISLQIRSPCTSVALGFD